MMVSGNWLKLFVMDVILPGESSLNRKVLEIFDTELFFFYELTILFNSN